MKIKDLFTEDVQKLLSEDSLDAIQTAFENKLKSSIDIALEAQDEVYAVQLEKLVQTIDQDHTKKAKKLVEAVDKNNAQKLVKVTNKFMGDSVVEAKKFKKQIVNTVSAYLDEFLTESISTADLKQAVQNKTAYNVLDSLRKTLAVDSSLMNPAIQEAVFDGKKQLVDRDVKLKDLNEKFNALTVENEKLKKDMLLESKISGFSKDKKTFLQKTFADKSLSFIKENLDYTIRLFDKKEKEKLTVLKEEAIQQRTVKPDYVKPEKVVTEKVNKNIDPETDPYVQVMSKAFGKR